MGAQVRRQALGAYVSQHRKIAAAVTISVIATAAIVPFATQASDQDGAQGRTQDSQSAGNADKMPDLDATDKSDAGKKTGGSQSTNSHSTDVTVNGQSIDVPENGTYDKTIEDGDSRTDVHVDSSQSSSTDGSSSHSSSSVKLNVSSESRSSSSE
jgi:hypothetical protein